MTTLITILIVLASIALVLVVIVQKSKGGGLAAGFSSANNIVGVRKATDGIEKATWYLMGTIIVLSILSTAFSGKGYVNSEYDALGEKAKQATSAPALGGVQQPVTSPNATPAQPTAPQAPANN